MTTVSSHYDSTNKLLAELGMIEMPPPTAVPTSQPAQPEPTAFDSTNALLADLGMVQPLQPQALPEGMGWFGQPPEPTGLDRVKHAMGAFVRGTAGTVSGEMGGTATLAKWVDEHPDFMTTVLGSPIGGSTKLLEGKKAEEFAIYKAGQALDDWAQKEFKGDPRLINAFWEEKVAQGAGSMIPLLLAGVAGGAIGVSSWATTAILGGLGQGGSTYQEAIDAGATESKALDAALIGMVIGTTEAAPISRAFDRLNKASGGKMMAVLKAAASGAAEESLQEMANSILSNLNAKSLSAYDKEREVMEGVFEAGKVGGVLGAMLSAGTTGIGMRRRAKKLASDDPALAGLLADDEAPSRRKVERIVGGDIADMQTNEEARKELHKAAAGSLFDPNAPTPIPEWDSLRDDQKAKYVREGIDTQYKYDEMWRGLRDKYEIPEGRAPGLEQEKKTDVKETEVAPEPEVGPPIEAATPVEETVAEEPAKEMSQDEESWAELEEVAGKTMGDIPNATDTDLNRTNHWLSVNIESQQRKAREGRSYDESLLDSFEREREGIKQEILSRQDVAPAPKPLGKFAQFAKDRGFDTPPRVGTPEHKALLDEFKGKKTATPKKGPEKTPPVVIPEVSVPQETTDEFEGVREAAKEGIGVFRGVLPEQPGKGFASDPGDFGRGRYWTTSGQRAEAIAGKEAVEPGTVKLDNPLILDTDEAYDLAEKYGTVTGEARMEGSQKLTDDMLAAGYDGIIVVGQKPGELEIVEFQPKKPPKKGPEKVPPVVIPEVSVPQETTDETAPEPQVTETAEEAEAPAEAEVEPITESLEPTHFQGNRQVIDYIRTYADLSDPDVEQVKSARGTIQREFRNLHKSEEGQRFIQKADTDFENMAEVIEIGDDMKVFVLPGDEVPKATLDKLRKFKVTPAMLKPKGMGDPKRQTSVLPKPVKNEAAAKVKAVSIAKSNEETRYAIDGVYVSDKEIVATDGRRLFVWKTDTSGVKRGVHRVDKKGKTLTVDNTPPEKGQKKHRLPGNFPIYKDVIPKFNSSDLVPLDSRGPQAVLTSLGQVSIMTSEGHIGTAMLRNPDGSLGFISATPEVGMAEVNVQDDAEFLAAIDPGFLNDAILFHARAGDADMKIYVSAPNKPIVIKGKNSLSVLVPLNIDKTGLEKIVTQPVAGTEAEESGGVDALKPPAAKTEPFGQPLPVSTPETSATAGPFSMTVQLEPAVEGKVGAREIIQWAERAFGTKVYRGRMRSPGALAHYRQRPEIIRALADVFQELSTITHELAHHIDQTFKIRKRGMPKAARKELKELDYEPEKARTAEGLAEYVRYLITSEIAETKAPKFHKWFHEVYLEQNPDLRANLETFRDMVTTYRAEGAMKRAESSMKKTQVEKVGPGKKLDVFLRRSQAWLNDDLAELERAQKAADKVKKLSLRERFYDYARVLGRREGALAEDAMRDGVKSLLTQKPVAGSIGLIEAFSKVEPFTRKSWGDFVQFIRARHSIDVWKQGKNPGLSRADAEHIFEKFKGVKGWIKLSNDITAWNKAHIFMLAEAGRIDESQAMAIFESYPHYVPLQRVLEYTPSGTGRSKVSSGKPIHTLKGAEMDVVDPMLAMQRQSVMMHAAAIKTLIGTSMVRALRSRRGMGQIGHKVPRKIQETSFTVEDIKKQLENIGVLEEQQKDMTEEEQDDYDKLMETALSVFRTEPFERGNEPIITIYENGKAVSYELDKELYGALSGLSEVNYPLWAQMIGKPLSMTRQAVRMGATALRPGFGWFMNPTRDIVHAAIQTEGSPLRMLAAGIWNNVSYLRAVMADAQGKKQDPVVAMWRRYGGELAGFIGQDLRKAMKHMKSLVNSAQGRARYNIVRNPIEFLKLILSFPEVGPRLAEFKDTLNRIKLDDGKTALQAVKDGDYIPLEIVVQAMLAGAESTIDFSKGGNLTRELNKVSAFSQVAVQGPLQALRKSGFHGINPKNWDKSRMFRTFLRGTALLTIPTMLYWYKVVHLFGRTGSDAERDLQRRSWCDQGGVERGREDAGSHDR